MEKMNKKILSHILSTMLIVAMAFCMTACSGADENQAKDEVHDVQVETGTQDEFLNAEDDEVTVLGEGATVFVDPEPVNFEQVPPAK